MWCPASAGRFRKPLHRSRVSFVEDGRRTCRVRRGRHQSERGQPAVGASPARGRSEGSEASARGEVVATASPTTVQCEGCQSSVRAPLGVVERPTTLRGDTRQRLLHDPPLVSGATISGQREGRHGPLQGVPLVIASPPPVSASPATHHCGTRSFVDPRIPWPQNDLFRDRAGLAATGGSPRTEPVPLPRKLTRCHTFRCSSFRDAVRECLNFCVWGIA